PCIGLDDITECRQRQRGGKNRKTGADGAARICLREQGALRELQTGRVDQAETAEEPGRIVAGDRPGTLPVGPRLVVDFEEASPDCERIVEPVDEAENAGDGKAVKDTILRARARAGC